MSIRSKLQTVATDLAVLRNIVRRNGTLCEGPFYSVLLEITSICNLKCPLCPTGTGKLKRKNKFMDLSTFDHIIEITAPLVKNYILGMWGEPVFHPELDYIFSKTSKHEAWISTNLNCKQSIVETLARWPHLQVICAVDTLDPETYARYRIGGDYERVLENLNIVVRGKSNVYLQFLVDDDYNLGPIQKFASGYGIPLGNIIIKNMRENFTLGETRKPIAGKCQSAYAGLYFNSDGVLVPCCNDVKHDLHMAHVGELKNTDDLLRSDRVAIFRKKLAANKNHYISCAQCSGETWTSTRLPAYKDYVKAVFSSGRLTPDRPTVMPFYDPNKERGEE